MATTKAADRIVVINGVDINSIAKKMLEYSHVVMSVGRGNVFLLVVWLGLKGSLGVYGLSSSGDSTRNGKSRDPQSMATEKTTSVVLPTRPISASASSETFPNTRW
jgi:hypothetical protein